MEEHSSGTHSRSAVEEEAARVEKGAFADANGFISVMEESAAGGLVESVEVLLPLVRHSTVLDLILNVLHFPNGARVALLQYGFAMSEYTVADHPMPGSALYISRRGEMKIHMYPRSQSHRGARGRRC